MMQYVTVDLLCYLHLIFWFRRSTGICVRGTKVYEFYATLDRSSIR